MVHRQQRRRHHHAGFGVEQLKLKFSLVDRKVVCTRTCASPWFNGDAIIRLIGVRDLLECSKRGSPEQHAQHRLQLEGAKHLSQSTIDIQKEESTV